MITDGKKNSGIDLSQYFDRQNNSLPTNNYSDKNGAFSGGNKKRKYLVMFIIGNFILGVFFFSYLISKSNELNSTAATSIEQLKAPENYQVKAGETYRLPLP